MCCHLSFTDDDSRVILHRENNDESDYINASYIDVCGNQ